MRYEVRFVGDDSLPAGVGWAFARTAGETYLFVKQSAIDTRTGQCDALTRAWEVWQSSVCTDEFGLLQLEELAG